MMLDDRVAMSTKWLKSTHQITGPAAFLRGALREIGPVISKSAGRLMMVEWDGAQKLSPILECNLMLLHRPAGETASG